MTNSPEPSYYEIALTNRQVLIAFVILLACVLVAFFSGISVGRGAGVKAEAGAVAAGPVTGGETMEEFRFFSESPPAAPRREASPPPSQPSAGEGSTFEPAPQPQPSTPSAALPDQEPERQPESPPAIAPGPEQQPIAREVPMESRGDSSQEARAEQAQTEPSPVREVDPPPTSELFVIQVFSTPEQDQARAVLDRLLGGGFRAFLSPVQVDGRTMYRVRVGPFQERAQAEDEASKLRRLYKLDTWITH